VELFKTNPYREEVRLAVFGAGDFLGEGPWIDDSPHSTSARAMRSTTVFSVHSDFFNVSAGTTLKVFSNIARVISRRMRNANARMITPAAQYESGKTRPEHDLLGEREVPFDSYYGVQTLRAIENFDISEMTLTSVPSLIECTSLKTSS